MTLLGPNDCEIHGYLPCTCEQLKKTIEAYLSRPKLRVFTLEDHGPWDVQRDFCLGCNRTKAELLNSPYSIIPNCNVT